MTGLGSDHDAGASTSNHIAELLQHERGSVEIDPEDRLRGRLRRGNTCGMDQTDDVAELSGRLNEVTNRGA